MINSIYEIKCKLASGEEVDFKKYEGHTLLVVNVASKCGFTSQYKGLESLYEKFKDRKVVVLGFPCNQFGGQEPGENSEILSFCSLNFGVTFPIFEKVDVNGDDAHPLFDYLKSKAPGLLGTKNIKWNFTKFLISRDGSKIERFAPTDTPEKIEKELSELLNSYV